MSRSCVAGVIARTKEAICFSGLGVGLLTVYLHNFFEWIFVTFPSEYLFAANAAIIAGLAQRLGYWKQMRAPAAQFHAWRSCRAAVDCNSELWT